LVLLLYFSSLVFFYLKLKWDEIGIAEKCWIFFILLLSVFGSIIGIYTSIIALVGDVTLHKFVLPDWFFYIIICCLLFVSLVGISVAMWKLYEKNN